MHRRIFLFTPLFLALMGIGVLGAGFHQSAARQEATPAHGGGTGVSTEVLGHQELDDFPGEALHLLRVTFAPGGLVEPHIHPGSTIYHIQEGSLVFTLLDGEASLVRAGHDEAAPAEDIPVGDEIMLGGGDTVHYDGSTVQTERNDGTVDAVVLISNLRGVDEPAREFVESTSRIQGRVLAH